jgi:hypothetical protein
MSVTLKPLLHRMATIQKRIYFTPTARTAALLRELGALTGQSPSRIVREMLDEASPFLQSSVDALRTVKSNPRKAAEAMGQVMSAVIGEAQQAQLDLETALRKKPGRKPKGARSG